MSRLTSDYWTQRYRQGNTPWQLNKPAPALLWYLNAQQLPQQTRILLPGAGAGAELAALLKLGYQHTYALDWAEAAFETLQAAYPKLSSDHLLVADFFEHTESYDLIYEQTFFPAIDPALRPAYARHMHQLLAPSGRLVGTWFTHPLTEQGPPFGGSEEEYFALFDPYFQQITISPNEHAAPNRVGKELFIEALSPR